MTRFAAVQMESRPLDVEQNLDRVLAGIGRAAEEGVEVVVFPECVLTGYVLSAEEAASVAEPIPGPRTERLSEACREAGLAAVVGTLEVDSYGHCYNTAVLVGSNGVLWRYRKTHLPFLGVDRYLASGDSLHSPFETPAGRLGLLICYDLRFPEPARALALEGAQVLLVSTAWPQAASLYPEFLTRARAAENSVYLVAANRVGVERGTRYLGRSIIVGTDGEVVSEAGSEAEDFLCADLDLTKSDGKKRVLVPGEYEMDLFGDRRPELYRGLSGD